MRERPVASGHFTNRREGIAVKRLLGLVVALTLVPAGTAGATGWGSNDLKVVDNPWFVVAKGPGFTVGLTQFGLHTHIDEDRFGIPEAGYPIVRNEQTVPVAATAVTGFQ